MLETDSSLFGPSSAIICYLAPEKSILYKSKKVLTFNFLDFVRSQKKFKNNSMQFLEKNENVITEYTEINPLKPFPNQ